jgi:hypothetical protein
LNQLEQPALAPLDAFSNSLNEARETHVGPLVAALKLAADNTEDAARRDALVAAFTRQKAFELALKDTAADFSTSESQARLLRHIAALLSRQMTNVRMTSMVADVAAEPAGLDRATRRRHAVAGIEQAALEQEIALITRTVSRAPAESPEDGPSPTALAVKGSLRRTNLLPAMHEATEATRSGLLADAVTRQTDVEKKISQLLDETLCVEPPKSIVRNAKKLLKQLTADERTLRTDTEGQTTDHPTLAERQERIEDRTEVLRRLLAVVAPEAAERVKQACKKMANASNCLSSGSGPGAVGVEGEAIALLEGAGGMLADQPGEEGSGGSGSGDSGTGQGPGENGDDDNENEKGSRANRTPGPGEHQEDQYRPHPNDDTLPPALVLGQLAHKEREALSAAEAEKTLPQYAPLVEQYLRSLAAPPPKPEP